MDGAENEARAARARAWLDDLQERTSRATILAAMGGACWLADFAACAYVHDYHLHAYGWHLCTALALRESGAVALDLVRLAPLRQRLDVYGDDDEDDGSRVIQGMRIEAALVQRMRERAGLATLGGGGGGDDEEAKAERKKDQ